MIRAATALLAAAISLEVSAPAAAFAAAATTSPESAVAPTITVSLRTEPMNPVAGAPTVLIVEFRHSKLGPIDPGVAQIFVRPIGDRGRNVTRLRAAPTIGAPGLRRAPFEFPHPGEYDCQVIGTFGRGVVKQSFRVKVGPARKKK